MKFMLLLLLQYKIMSLLFETYRKIDPEGEINNGFQDEENKDSKFQSNLMQSQKNLEISHVTEKDAVFSQT